MLTERIRRAHAPADNRLFQCGSWLIAALCAGSLLLFSTLPTHRHWALAATLGYVAAAAARLLLPARWARPAAVVTALAGAVVLPLGYLLLTGGAQSEVGVVERAGRLLVEQGTPYLADPQTVGEVTPYLPGMALFGLPRVVFGDGGPAGRVLGDARLWCALALLCCLWAGRRLLRPASGAALPARSSALGTGALVASPVVALPVAVSGIDLPLAGLLCLALAGAARGRPATAGLALAAACSLKWTAVPAVVVAVVLLVRLAGRRAALRCAATALAGTAALVLPGVLRAPRAAYEQVLAFPTGRGDLETPADSPLPGGLLADLGPWGWYAAVALLLAGGAAVALSLVVRPPYDLVSAADRLALGLCTAFLLAPAGRFGYLVLPVVLVVWARLADGGRRAGAGSRIVAAAGTGTWGGAGSTRQAAARMWPAVRPTGALRAGARARPAPGGCPRPDPGPAS
ncbi:glycosyltransferase 87 family protein [Streptomyces bambusae]|uniref:glycosyltransferase 87 family protein n=1 Tax=Streptomyces bambusae TaxID=1550616 RepID=UPI001CFEDDC5|nr:glycosyltransferase 87 family protein [Streptomyces bambusae]MCB5164139.1 glycosyltransferase 87 family protein [Streptomyces bambusae]